MHRPKRSLGVQAVRVRCRLLCIYMPAIDRSLSVYTCRRLIDLLNDCRYVLLNLTFLATWLSFQILAGNLVLYLDYSVDMYDQFEYILG